MARSRAQIQEYISLGKADIPEDAFGIQEFLARPAVMLMPFAGSNLFLGHVIVPGGFEKLRVVLEIALFIFY